MPKDKTQWEFTDEWFGRAGVTTLFFETNNKAFTEKRGTTEGMVVLDEHDANKVKDFKLYFGSFNSGLYIWKDGRKRYLHRYFLETDGEDLTDKRVGFIDDNPFNLQVRNLYRYTPGAKPLINKWKAKREALESLHRKGLVRKVATT